MNYLKLLKLPFAIFLVVYFIFLVMAQAPAAWAVWAVHKAAPSLWLSSPQGSLWRGQARSSQIDIGHAQIPLGEIKWRLSPWTLLWLKPCVDFSASLPKQTLSGEFCRSFDGQMHVSNLMVDAPVQVIQAINPIEATGSLSLQVSHARFDEKGYVHELDGRLSWQNARAFAVESWLNLGTFAATAEHDGSGGLNAKIFDLDSDYKVDMVAVLAHGAPDWKVKGTVSPNASAPEMVTEFLSVVAEDLGDGRYQVQWP